jgi:hypothetical protein
MSLKICRGEGAGMGVRGWEGRELSYSASFYLSLRSDDDLFVRVFLCFCMSLSSVFACCIPVFV